MTWLHDESLTRELFIWYLTGVHNHMPITRRVSVIIP